MARKHFGNTECLAGSLVAVVSNKGVVDKAVDVLGCELLVDKFLYKPARACTKALPSTGFVVRAGSSISTSRCSVWLR